MIPDSVVRLANTYSHYDHQLLQRVLGEWRGRVLDIGCGTGRLQSALSAEHTEYIGIDLYGGGASIKVDIAQESYPFPDNSFDHAICNAVLEHVADPTFVVKEMYRILKPGGTAYVSIPFLQPYHADPEDYRRYTSVGLQQVLAQAGFRCQVLPGVNGMFIVFEYMALFELVEYLKHPRRFFNPARWLELVFLGPLYLGAKVLNLGARWFRNDSYATPGVNVLANKPL